jgi:hypothetical protein
VVVAFLGAIANCVWDEELDEKLSFQMMGWTSMNGCGVVGSMGIAQKWEDAAEAGAHVL